MKSILPPANDICEGYVFTGVCLSTGGVRGRGHAWQEGRVVGGMHGRGACVAKGCVRGRGDMRGGGGGAWQAAFVAGGYV